jgi:hypothetical protein
MACDHEGVDRRIRYRVLFGVVSAVDRLLMVFSTKKGRFAGDWSVLCEQSS